MTLRIDTAGHDARAPRAPWYVTLANPLLRRVLASGVRLGPNALVTIRGRRSGEPRTTPLAIVRHDDRMWVWAPWAGANWVANLRAAGHATITVRGRSQEVDARELDDAERAVFFRDVLIPVAKHLPGGLLFVRVIDGVDLRHPEAEAEGRAVFELRAVG